VVNLSRSPENGIAGYGIKSLQDSEVLVRSGLSLLVLVTIANKFMIEALIFDFDGLILDTEVPEYQSWAELCDAHR
jgi:hypothetical protein